MSFRGQYVDVQPVKGIYNGSRAPQLVDDGYCWDAVNVRIQNGAFAQRGGFRNPSGNAHPASSSSNPVSGIYEKRYDDGTYRRFVVAGGKIAELTSVYTDRTGAVSIPTTQSCRIVWAELNNLIIGSAGGTFSGPFKISQTAGSNAAALGGTPPTGSISLLSYRNRLLVGGYYGNERTVKWSGLNNPELWSGSGTGSATPRLSAGQNITALSSVRQDAFLFYDKAIHRIIPQSDPNAPFSFPEHSDSLGAVSRTGVVSAPDVESIFFASRRGIYQMQAPSYSPKLISDSLDAIWNPGDTYGSIYGLPTLVQFRLDEFVATVNPLDSEVWFSVMGTDSGDVVEHVTLVYNYKDKAWTRFTNIKANSFGLFTDSSFGDVYVVHGSYNERKAFTHEHYAAPQGDDDGTTVTASMTSKAYSLIDSRRRGSVRRLGLQTDIQTTAAADDCTVSWGHDLKSLSRSTTIDLRGGSGESGQMENEVNIDGQGRFFQFKLSRSSSSDLMWKVNGIQLGIVPETGLPAAA